MKDHPCRNFRAATFVWSPLGDINVFAEDDAVVSLDWVWGPQQQPPPILEKAREQLYVYFDGQLTKFDLKRALDGTAYSALCGRHYATYPYGKTYTYQDIVYRAGGSARLVGQANSHRPIPMIIP